VRAEERVKDGEQIIGESDNAFVLGKWHGEKSPFLAIDQGKIDSLR
jgi:hypothetical protein